MIPGGGLGALVVHVPNRGSIFPNGAAPAVNLWAIVKKTASELQLFAWTAKKVDR